MKYELELRPFTVPNFVLATNPAYKDEDISIPIEKLSDETIDVLCKKFCADIKKKKLPRNGSRAPDHIGSGV